MQNRRKKKPNKKIIYYVRIRSIDHPAPGKEEKEKTVKDPTRRIRTRRADSEVPLVIAINTTSRASTKVANHTGEDKNRGGRKTVWQKFLMLGG